MLLQSFVLLISINSLIAFQPPWMFMGRPLSGFRLQETNSTLINLYSHLIPEQYFDQNLDHFNPSSNITWKQRFWRNDAYGTLKGPQFLILGGEAPASVLDVALKDYPHVQYASEIEANLWTLEHRYYGKSMPLDNLATQHLSYLTSDQAIEDIAFFIKSQNTLLNLTDPKWIIIGGSYAGSLALWFRRKYPDLSAGALVSSAPVVPVYNFYGHLQYVETVLNNFDKACYENIREDFLDFTFKLKNSTSVYKVILDEIYTFIPALNTLDFNNNQTYAFIYSIFISYYQSAVQYNKVNNGAFANDIGIAWLCDPSHVNNQKYLDIAYTVENEAKSLQGFFNGNYISYLDFIQYLQNSNSTDSNQASLRAWLWQSCNEFGYFPTTSGGYSVFLNDIQIKFYESLCFDVFERNFDHSYRSFDTTTKDYNGTNVLAPRGSNDPWGTLALQNSHNPTVITYLINETGHCGDMAPPSDKDSMSLTQYRAIALRIIKEWLGIPGN